MSNRLTVVLRGEDEAFIEAQLRRGTFESPEAVVHAGLRLLHTRTDEIDALSRALHGSGPVATH